MSSPDPSGPGCEVTPEESREAFDALLDVARQPLLVLDGEACVVAANDAFESTFRTDADSLVGERLAEACGGLWDIPELHAFVADVARGHPRRGHLQLDMATPAGEAVRFEARRLGESDRVLLSVEPVTPGGAGRGTDVDAGPGQADAEHIDEFLSILGHELRSPLSAIHNVSRLLSSERPLPPARVEELYRILERQTGHVVRLVDDVLDYSRLNTRMLDLQRVKVSMRECVVASVSGMESRAENARVDLSVDLPAEDVWVNGDPVRITEILTNLIDNAIKYNSSGGNVWLSVRREGREAVVRVRDDGIGIAPEALDSVFDVFTRLEYRARGQKGLGLGLALVRQFVALHGGEVDVHSEGRAHGAEFVVRLPATDAPAPAAGGDVEPERGARRILLVDDNADSVDTLAGLLELSGHEVRTAYNGPDALDVVAGFAPEVILLDIGMPDMDGFEVARRLREEGYLDGVRLVALTGYGLSRDQQEVRSAGFDMHVLKPVRLDELERAVYGDE